MKNPKPPPGKQIAPEPSSVIHSLIAACNKNDRFKLLEDDSVLPANLDTPIHPIFSWFPTKGPMKQMLQLASYLVSDESFRVFLVPLLYGREHNCIADGKKKTYLSNPFTNASNSERAEYLSRVQKSLLCLSHSITFVFRPPEKRVYARTLRVDKISPHTSTCSTVFQRRYSCIVELADYFENYYKEDGGYSTASRCAQFRHDFLFAATLVHEIVHTIGVLRRGDLSEPYIGADYPETEWGYGWEHFMFGIIINPQDRTRPGTHLLMCKFWADPKVAKTAGGKEYCDVPMSYVAQWFRKETWDLVREQGPAAIPPPITHFKIQSSNTYGAWIVTSSNPHIKQDLLALYLRWRQYSSDTWKRYSSSSGGLPSVKIFWRLKAAELLQVPNVPLISRIDSRFQFRPSKLLETMEGCVSTGETVYVKTVQAKVALSQLLHPIQLSHSRKRRADPLLDSSRPLKRAT